MLAACPDAQGTSLVADTVASTAIVET